MSIPTPKFTLRDDPFNSQTIAYHATQQNAAYNHAVDVLSKGPKLSKDCGLKVATGQRPSWTLRILSCASEGSCNSMAQASRKFLDISVFDGQSETPRRQPRVEASQRDHIRCFL